MTTSGYIQTVLGAIDPDEMGVTMPHEHLLVDVSPLYVEPTTSSDKFMSRQPITIENLWWMRYHYNNHLDNLRLDDEQVAIEEALLYKREGGRTIVDATTIGEAPDPLGLARISRVTGLHVVAATGYYVASSHPPEVADMSEDDIAAKMIDHITRGIDDTGVRAGIMGELGCSWPLHADERKVLVAAGMTQRETGVAISIHPGRDEAAPMEIIDILTEAGAAPEKIIMGHIERTVFNLDTLKEIADTGSLIEWDLFGQDLSYYSMAPHIARPTDAQRLDQIAWLIGQGHADKVLVSHDIGGKTHLVKYGGHGYGHIMRVVVPWMRRRGFKEEDIEAMLVDNPKRALTIE